MNIIYHNLVFPFLQLSLFRCSLLLGKTLERNVLVRANAFARSGARFNKSSRRISTVPKGERSGACLFDFVTFFFLGFVFFAVSHLYLNLRFDSGGVTSSSSSTSDVRIPEHVISTRKLIAPPLGLCIFVISLFFVLDSEKRKKNVWECILYRRGRRVL